MAALRDQIVYTPEQVAEHINIRVVAWRTDEDATTMGVPCIEAVLTLFNDRLQQANDPHVRFLPSYYGMETQRSDDPVHERCMGIDFAAQRYVVAPASVDANHWAVIVWDNLFNTCSIASERSRPQQYRVTLTWRTQQWLSHGKITNVPAINSQSDGRGSSVDSSAPAGD